MKILSFLCIIAALVGVIGCSTPSDNALKASNDRQPKVLKRFEPIYPFELKIHGVTGEAVVEFIVDTKGNVVQPTVVKATRKEFGLSAIDCISKWKFSPGLKDGRAVRCRMQQQFIFSIEKGK